MYVLNIIINAYYINRGGREMKRRGRKIKSNKTTEQSKAKALKRVKKFKTPSLYSVNDMGLIKKVVKNG